ncbi:histidine kinase [Corynebacterium belfantii]|uniref:sensor histidine kinase n=1 Tax=Corynebacterium belfantii TaxID=2014537 RepID=UPI0018D3F086|nr:histidine kinase [Corynebacterium belfantii]MBG9320481.1 histidine kinase [Corynebacterium belfantii]MBG9332098.1 histidine kinase [Corynebacterium belfantii]
MATFRFLTPSFWIQLVIQTIVAFVSLGFISATELVSNLDISPAWQTVLYTCSHVGIALTYVGLLLQRWKPVSGVTTVTVGLVFVSLSLTSNFLAGYVAVCYEAWFISARIMRHRSRWLIALFVGSFGSITFNLLFPILLETGRVVGLKEIIQEPQAWLFAAIVATLVVVSIALFWQLGLSTKRKAEELRDLRARAELAAVSERNRIAREMHDIVAHSLTVVIAQADGGRFAGRDNPQQALNALETISSVGREALSQMRGLLSVLRETDDRDVTAALGIESVGTLIHEAELAGLDIHYEVVGEPQALDESRSLSVFRIVQECLTNVLKHAGTTRAWVIMDWSDPSVVRIKVDNEAGEALVDTRSTGKGLIGVKERALIHGGRARWGASISYVGGWYVEAEIPVKG